MLSNSQLQSAPRRFRHLGKFVDRVVEYQKFETLVGKPADKREKFFLAFYGPIGIGKSMLLQRLEFECAKRRIANARIVLDQGGDINDPIEILRDLAGQLGNEEFAKWFEVEKYWFSPADLNINVQAQQGSINVVADHAEFHGDIVAGSKVQISQINMTTNAALNRSAAQNALTQTFLQVLAEFVKKKMTVIIFDGFDSEEFTNNTRKWLTDSFLGKIRDFGGYGVLPMIALVNRPNFSDPSLIDDTAQFLLKPLSRDHIVEYLHIRKIPHEIIAEVAETCLRQTQGVPSLIYGFVETLLNSSDEA